MKNVLLLLVGVVVGCGGDDGVHHLADAPPPVETAELVVTRTGNGSGTVSGPAGIACGATCMATLPIGSTLTLAAAPGSGSQFTGWSGACTGTAPTCDITLSADTAVTATFTLQKHTVTLHAAGPGTGAIQGTGVDCSADCTLTVDHGIALSFTATPRGLSVFAGWGGACTGTSTCMVTVTSDLSIDASFALDSFTLFASKTGNGAGTVSSTPAGIDCGATCAHSFSANQVVTLTATPAMGATFGGWSGGGCTGTGTCTVTIDAAKTVTATFTLASYALAVTKVGAGMVSSSPTGIDCGATCTASFTYGTPVTLTATAAIGYTFTGWNGGGCTGTGACVVTIDAAKSVTATFTIDAYTLSVTKVGSGTVTSSPVGISCGATCSAPFSYGTPVTLTATAATGYTFAGWSGGTCTGTGTCLVTVDAAKSVTATFTIDSYTVSVTKVGSGTVTSSPAGISCGATCDAPFTYGTPVTLTAAAATGYTFTGWGGACTGTGTCVVTVDAAKSVTATFTIDSYALSVTKVGMGTVTSSPAGISCGATCSGSFTYGTAVTLTASAAMGYTFMGWSGACSGTGTCTVTMDAVKSVTATFTINSYALSVTKLGAGTVMSSPAGITCGAMCSAPFTYGTVVTLTAAASAGSTFTGWSGACSGTGTCVVTVDATKSVTATFTLDAYALSVAKVGLGTVTSSPAGISCGGTCSASFAYPTPVTLTAMAAAGYTFTGWSGDCAGTGTCQVTMDAAKSVTATFTVNSYALSVTKAGTGTGTVTSSPAGINCGATCSAAFVYPTSVMLTATPSGGSTFTGWSGDCMGTGTCQVTMDAAKNVTATFAAAPTFDVVLSSNAPNPLPTYTRQTFSLSIAAHNGPQSNGQIVVYVNSSVSDVPATTFLGGWSESGWTLDALGNNYTNVYTRASLPAEYSGQIDFQIPFFAGGCPNGSTFAISDFAPYPSTAEATSTGSGLVYTIGPGC